MENFIPIPALYGATIERERLLANMLSQIGKLYENKYGVKRPTWMIQAKDVPMMHEILREFRKLCIES